MSVGLDKANFLVAECEHAPRKWFRLDAPVSKLAVAALAERKHGAVEAEHERMVRARGNADGGRAIECSGAPSNNLRSQCHSRVAEP